MNRVAADGGYDALVTGHNRDDEAVVLSMDTLPWQADYKRRQAPVLPSLQLRLVRKTKPLCYKELLTQLEHRSPGSKLQLYPGLLRACEAGPIQAAEEAAPIETCTRCGQPTHADGPCALRRLWEAHL